MLHRLLLLPLLSPLLVTLLVAALNPSPSLALRLLTWQTPSLPIGLWMAVAAGGGAALSAGATALALRQGGRPPLRRTVRRPDRLEDDTWSAPWGDRSEGRTAAAPAAPAASSAAGPSRAPGEPAPTVSVPYRVLHRPEATVPRPFRPEPAVASRPPAPVPASAADDWGHDDGEEW
ncbi:hypothetical protein [Aphanothece minutissima]|uniref:DUF1049 domain-containing protein n=1 Tax=Aphanothece cf. minutissima CCALA 015 TaxID=2107695 RepID=A0ABX5FAY1_9CHRO|nr:hypothetical protein [Aphanothece minutissima]PSB38845.1 hypothetical protein C7B81_04670 [Aphanothece cf. minutissima CCALA 015]